MGLETDFYKLTNGMTPKITPPVTRSFSPPSLLWLAPALAADLMGKLGGNEFRDNQLAKIGKGYDPNTGLSKPYFGGQSLDRISEQAAPPFTGGQSAGAQYFINARVSQPTHGRTSEVLNMYEVSAFGAITEARVGFDANGYISVIYKGRDSVGAPYNRSFMMPSVFPNVPFVVDYLTLVRVDGLPDAGGNIPTPETFRDGDTSTKGDDNTTDRQRRAGGSPPPPFIPNGTNTTVSNVTNNTTNSNTTVNNNNIDNRVSNVTNSNYNSNGDVNKSFSPPTPLVTPSAPPIVKPSIAPDPKPDKKEEEKKVPPPFTPPIFNGDIGTQLAFLGGTLGVIAANTSPQAQRTNSKNGSCDALQEPSCREGLKNDIVNPINQNIDATKVQTAAILGNQASQNTVLAAITSKLTDVFELVGKVFNNSIVDKAMQYITMITTIHNAVMLSRGIGDTLGSAFDNGLTAFGLQIKDKDGNQQSVTQIIGKSFTDLVKGIVGTDNFTALNNTWLNANRVYQTGINLLSNVQSILDSSVAVGELANNRIGTLMNALRNCGGVREDAYGSQSKNVTKFNAFQNKLEALEQGVSNTASITGNIVSVQQSVNEFKTNRTEFEKAIKDEGVKVEEVKAEKREESIFKIADFTIVRPPEVTP